MKPAVALMPLRTIYSAITRARLEAYRRGWLSVKRLPVPVISVGNLTTGGTGKTPLVEWVCRTLATTNGDQKRKICVLTRGYGRDKPTAQVVVSNGAELLAGEHEAGDEPFLLAQKLLGIAAIIANPNRFAAGQWALENLQTEVFVLDDGFQHLRLARDLNIVTIDAANPWGDAGGRLLPQGRLREPCAGLARADCVVITRSNQTTELASLHQAIERLAGGIPIFTSRMVTAGWRDVAGQSVAAETVLAQRLAAFCGVGNPESFFSHLRQAGCSLNLTRPFADHHVYNQTELDRLVHDARKADASGLVTTAKDAVKLVSLKLALPCYVLDINIALDQEEQLASLVRQTHTT
jgi:tetraacyldisaccharide 4'-kinase